MEVYSAADEVELILNGRSVGRQPAGKENHNRAVFELKYEWGILEAVSYRDGREVSSDRVRSAGMPAGIRITQEPFPGAEKGNPADGQSLVFARVEVVDAKGNFVPWAEPELTAQVEGPAVLAAFGSARTETEENYTSGKAAACQGRVLAILRAGYEAGKARLTVRAEGMPEAVLEVEFQ